MKAVRNHQYRRTVSDLRIFVAVQSIDQFDPYYFDEHGVGVEIQDLLHFNLDDDAAASITERYRERLLRFHGPVAFHACVPPRADSISEQTLLDRYRRMTAAAKTLGASTIIFHSGIDPAASTPGDIERLTEFWRGIRTDIESAGITAALENVLEDDYRPLLSLIRAVDSPRIGICLDLGHHHLNSKQVIEEWLLNLSHHIRHIHIHTNDGADDAHDPIGDAALRRFIGLCADHDLVPAISFEYREMSAELIRREAGRLRAALGNVSSSANTGTLKQLRTFLMQIALPAALALSLFSALIFGFIIPKYEDIIMDRKREMIRELVRSAVSVATRLEKDARAGRMTDDDARREAAKLIGQMRYGPEVKDYFWITDMHPRMIIHPYRTDLNDTDLAGFTDPGGKKLFNVFVAVVRSNGGGYVDYRWQWKDDPANVVPKLSYVEGFAPWGWIIGTGMYIEDVKAEIARIEQRLIFISFGITIIVALILAYLARVGFRLDRRRMLTEESLRAAREKYRLLVEASTEGILMCSGKSIIFSNAQARTMLGWSEEEFAALDPDGLFTADAASAWAAAGKRMPARFESPVRTKSGIPFDALVIATPVSFADRDGVIIILRSTAAGDAPARTAYDHSPTGHDGPAGDDRTVSACMPVAASAQALFVRYTDRVKDIVRQMDASDFGVVIVAGEEQAMLGIITDRTIREWAARGGDDAAAYEIMRAPVAVVPEGALAFEADIAADRGRTDWVALRSAQGVTGLSYRDPSRRNTSPGGLIQAIREARSAEEIRSLHDRLPLIAGEQCDAGIAPRMLVRICTAVACTIIERYCALAEADVGAPPCAYSFITLGSVARGEQTLVSDQDNAIIYQDGGSGGYFQELGQRVCVLLNRTGYAYCDGRIMAKSERWCAPLSRWKEYYSAWAATGDPEDILDLSIFFDLRAVSAESALADDLRAHILRVLPGKKPLMHHLARIAHGRRLPVGGLGALLSETVDGIDVIDLKKIMLAAVDTARVFALDAGLSAMDTRTRIAWMKDNGICAPSDGEAIIDAYDALMDMRIRHQMRCIRERREPDNRIAVKGMNEFEHDTLRSAIARIALLQRLLEKEFSIS
ncbi:MAG: DUF294 nucleotidyltransferase-like domain-containing protein [Spirochaetota bacterium]